MRHVVMFSGGLGSWMTAKRVAAQHRTDNLTLLFADVGGTVASPHSGEDEDTYRFIREAAVNVGGELVTVMDAQGRDIWQIFKDDRFLGNSRLANCSKYGKQKPCRDWLDANCDPAETVLYVGLDWSEPQREQELRDHLGKDVSILKDRTGGDARPMTLGAFRERIEDQPELFDPLEWGGCACFVGDEASAS